MPDSRHKTVLMADDDPEDCMPGSHAFAGKRSGRSKPLRSRLPEAELQLI
jgi:hypothetical protein